MANPVSYQILTAIKTRLDAITTIGGFNYDPTIKLGWQNVNPDEVDAAPVITVYESGDAGPDEENFCQTMLIPMEITIEAYMRIDGTTAEDLAKLWQDIIKAVLLTDTTLGGLAASVQRGARDYEYPTSGGQTVAVRQVVSVQYFETYGNP